MNRFCRVAAYLSSPYCCVHSAQCTVRLTLHCAQRTVHTAIYKYAATRQN